MERYLLNYIKENTNNQLVNKYIDYFKIELDWYIYNYGNNISADSHTSYRNGKKKKLILDIIKQLQYTSSLILKANSKENNILSGVSFKNTNLLTNLGLNLISSVFQPVKLHNILGDTEAIRLLNKKNNFITKGTFNDLYNISFFQEFEVLKDKIIQSYSKYNFKGLFLKTDQTFESKYLIDIFKSINKPSFIFSHGLPGIYSKDVDNRSDYLMVWGEQIKQNYVDSGFNADKIFVVGSPFITKNNKNIILRNSIDDILVIPCSSSLWHQHEWDMPKLIDRSMCILYLYQVQNVLQQLGVKQVRFRPHPSVNAKWVYNFIDTNFYKIDNEPLDVSLNRSTLVIGSTSTVFIEAILKNVNYIVFEPNEDGISILRQKIVTPFDGSDNFVVVAKDEEELLYLLKSKYQINPNIVNKYLQPMDLRVINELIKLD